MALSDLWSSALVKGQRVAAALAINRLQLKCRYCPPAQRAKPRWYTTCCGHAAAGTRAWASATKRRHRAMITTATPQPDETRHSTLDDIQPAQAQPCEPW